MSTEQTVRRELPWAQVDVFAERRLEGNPLAIFTDARGLTTEQMQALARETNLSETTFILPEDEATEREHGVRVRIFTVQEELPFAGHPTLGTASWLWANHPTLRGADEIKLKLNVGTVPVRFTQPAAGEHGAYNRIWGEMRQRDPEFGALPDPAAIAHACGLSADDLHPTLLPQTVSTGLAMCIVPLRSLEALCHLRVNSAMDTLLADAGAKFAYVIAPTGDALTWRARLQFYNGEDPATGSAAGCAISYLVRHGAVPSGAQAMLLQGEEILRPSRLYIRACLLQHDEFRAQDEANRVNSEARFLPVDEHAVTDVFVAGRTIPVASGSFTLG